MVKLTLDYPTSSLCNSAGRMTLAEKVKQRLHALNSVWKLCGKRCVQFSLQSVFSLKVFLLTIFSSQKGACESLNVTVNCVTKSSPGRIKRQTVSPTEFYSTYLIFSASRYLFSHIKLTFSGHVSFRAYHVNFQRSGCKWTDARNKQSVGRSSKRYFIKKWIQFRKCDTKWATGREYFES